MGKTFFITDAHLGSKMITDPLTHEKKVVDLLTHLQEEGAETIYLMGDMFDFWFEYKYVVPKGHVRFLGKLAELADKGIQLHFFIGNHDIWTFGYLEKEIGMHIHRTAEDVNINATSHMEMVSTHMKRSLLSCGASFTINAVKDSLHSYHLHGE